MPKKQHANLGVKAALWEIQKQSPFCRMSLKSVDYKHEESRNHEPEWIFPEAALAWAVFEQTALDAYGFTNSFFGDEDARRREIMKARRILRDGCAIGKGNGRMDVLSALGIDEGWAVSVLDAVVSGHKRLIDHGWTPDGR